MASGWWKEEIYHGDSSSEALVTLNKGTLLPPKKRGTVSYISRPVTPEISHPALVDWKDIDASVPHKDLNKKKRRGGTVQVPNLRHWHSPCSLT